MNTHLSQSISFSGQIGALASAVLEEEERERVRQKELLEKASQHTLQSIENRKALVRFIAENGPVNTTDMRSQFPWSESTLSLYLKTLRGTKEVIEIRSGNRRKYVAGAEK